MHAYPTNWRYKDCLLKPQIPDGRWIEMGYKNLAKHYWKDAIHSRILGNTEYWKLYVVKHNYVTEGVFKGYTGQLHVSAYTGHPQIV